MVGMGQQGPTNRQQSITMRIKLALVPMNSSSHFKFHSYTMYIPQPMYIPGSYHQYLYQNPKSCPWGHHAIPDASLTAGPDAAARRAGGSRAAAAAMVAAAQHPGGNVLRFKFQVPESICRDTPARLDGRVEPPVGLAPAQAPPRPPRPRHTARRPTGPGA